MATTLIPKDFKEFVVLLNAKEVEYLLIGGYALMCHGHPRATKDIDFWVRRSPDNASKVCKVLREFGFDPPEGTEARLCMPDQIFQMGFAPIMIDVTTSISGVEFDECYGRSVAADLDGVPVKLIALEDFKKNKLASGRDRDKGDIKILEGKE